MPAGWSFAEAASVPGVFLTAYYGLVDLAGLQAGRAAARARRGRWRGHGRGAARQAPGRRGVRHGEPREVGRRWKRGGSMRRISPPRGTLGSGSGSGQATEGRGVDVVLNSLAR